MEYLKVRLEVSVLHGFVEVSEVDCVQGTMLLVDFKVCTELKRREREREDGEERDKEGQGRERKNRLERGEGGRKGRNEEEEEKVKERKFKMGRRRSSAELFDQKV